MAAPHCAGFQAWETSAPLRATSVATFFHLGHFHILFPFPRTFSPTFPPFAWFNPIQLSDLSALTICLVGSRVTVTVPFLTLSAPGTMCLSVSIHHLQELQTASGRNRVCLGSWIGSEYAWKEGMIVSGLLKEKFEKRSFIHAGNSF